MCFCRQDASNDTRDDPNGTALQFDPGHGQGHLIAIDLITCGVRPQSGRCYQNVANFQQFYCKS